MVLKTIRRLAGPVMTVAGVATGNPALMAAGAGVSAASSGMDDRDAAKDAQRKENDYLDRLEDFTDQSYDMRKSLTIAKRDESVRAIQLREANERKFAAHKDLNNKRAYEQSLAIYNYQNKQLSRQFDKSEELYRDALSLNARAAQSAREKEIRVLMETRQKFAFENEDNIIQDLIASGTIAASGVQGRSAAKAGQSQLAALGRNQAVMTESMVSATRNSHSNLKDISRQLDQANTGAKARRMLKPEFAPAPLKPLTTIINDYQLPRELQDFDFGVRPIRGQSTVSVPSWGSVFANAAAGAVSSYAENYTGTPRGQSQGVGQMSFNYTPNSQSSTTSWGGMLDSGLLDKPLY